MDEGKRSRAAVLTGLPVPATWVLCLAGLAALVLMFWPTMRSIVHQWDTSSAYTYGYLIAPITAYLLSQERQIIGASFSRPQMLGLAVVAAFAALWWASDVLDVNIGRHVALVGMMQGVCLTALGWPQYKQLAFPLNYLWLMVPAGEALLYPLQLVAHAGSVVLLQLTGIPVFAEGLFIQVPQGNFEVEPGCAGLNFVLSGLALALVYGRVMYRRPVAILACVAIALTAAVVANIVRIFLIIALTEWTERRIGLADDHLLFGWGVFAVVMLALMWAGLRYAVPQVLSQDNQPAREPRTTLMHCTVAVCAALGVAGSIQILRHAIDDTTVLRVAAPYLPPSIVPSVNDAAKPGI